MAGRAVIEVKGLEKTLRALSVIDPEVNKSFRRGFRDVGNEIFDLTKRRTPLQPLTNWGGWGERLDWDAARARRQMSARVSAGARRASLRLVSKNPAAALFENAGRIQPNSPFNRTIRSKFGAEPRLLLRTWKDEKGIRRVYTAVGRLVEMATERVNRAID